MINGFSHELSIDFYENYYEAVHRLYIRKRSYDEQKLYKTKAVQTVPHVLYTVVAYTLTFNCRSREEIGDNDSECCTVLKETTEMLYRNNTKNA